MDLVLVAGPFAHEFRSMTHGLSQLTDFHGWRIGGWQQIGTGQMG